MDQSEYRFIANSNPNTSFVLSDQLIVKYHSGRDLMRTFRSAWHTSLACVHLWKLNLRCLAGANRRVCGMGSPHREWCRRRGLRTIGDGKLSAAVASVTAGEPTPSQNHIMSSSL